MIARLFEKEFPKSGQAALGEETFPLGPISMDLRRHQTAGAQRYLSVTAPSLALVVNFANFARTPRV